jgi:general secretion pathway protein D
MNNRFSNKQSGRPASMVLGLALLILGTTAFPTPSAAQSYSAERARFEREQAVYRAREYYWQGVALRNEGNLEEAGSYFRTALDTLPVVERTESERAAMARAFGEVCVELALARADEGNLRDANRYMDVALNYAPDYEPAKELKERLGNPEWYAPGDDRQHRDAVDRVNRNLRAGHANIGLGRFDEAEQAFMEVLRDDETNSAARRGMEEVERQRMEYLRPSYDRTRAEMLDEIASKWAMPVPKAPGVAGAPGADLLVPAGETREAISRKLAELIVPEINLEEVNVRTAIDYLSLRSTELDPEGRGIRFVLDTQSISAVDAEALTRQFTVILQDTPIGVVLNTICELAGLRPNVEQYAVKIVPSASAASEQLISKDYSVPPSFEKLGVADDGGGAAADDPFATAADQPAFAPRATAEEILKSRGIPWPEGASAFYISGSSTLTVKNTRSNMELVDAFVDSIQERIVKQVEINVRFVEIQQNNQEELSFDWLLGGLGLGGDEVFVGGGVPGNSRAAFNAESYPFVQTGLDPNGNPVVSPVGVHPVTGALRSGNQAISSNALDALIQDLPRGQADALASAPGILSLAGILTDPEFQVVMRGLSQKKGADLVTAPRVVTRGGQRAKIEVIRELIYPVEFDPPELPQRVGVSEGGFFPVTPSHPTTFEMRPTGVTLEVDPQPGPDNFQIDLTLAPEVVEFEGFVNYGSPITAAGTDAAGNPTRVLITDNRIDLPLFATRRVSTNVTVYDGSTVALGGLIREDVQHVTDKIPLVGDLPYVGRLFRSEVEQSLRRNLVIFVSAKLIDPSGQAFRKLREETDAITTEFE